MTHMTKKNQFVRICTDKISQSTYRFFGTNCVYFMKHHVFSVFRGENTGTASVLADGVAPVFYCLKSDAVRW